MPGHMKKKSSNRGGVKKTSMKKPKGKQVKNKAGIKGFEKSLREQGFGSRKKSK